MVFRDLLRFCVALFTHSAQHITILAFLISACSAQAAPPAADTPQQPGVESLLGGSFVTSHEDEKLRRAHALAGELARTVERLDGVEEARVHLSLADKSLLSRDNAAQSSAAILVRCNRAAGPDEGEIRDLVVAAVPGLAPSNVSIFFSKPEQVERTVFVGPIEVASSSVGVARKLLGGLIVLCLAMACSLVWAGLTLRKRRRRDTFPRR